MSLPHPLVNEADGAVVKSWWNWHVAIANTLLTGSWLIEQHTIRTKRKIDPIGPTVNERSNPMSPPNRTSPLVRGQRAGIWELAGVPFLR